MLFVFQQKKQMFHKTSAYNKRLTGVVNNLPLRSIVYNSVDLFIAVNVITQVY